MSKTTRREFLKIGLAAAGGALAASGMEIPLFSGSNSSMQVLWQVLYNAGAELVINGHEHNYERFDEMNASGAAVSQGLREIGTVLEGEIAGGYGISYAQFHDSAHDLHRAHG